MERKATLAETTNFGAPTTNSDEMDAGDKKLEPESPAYVAPATPPIMAPVVTIVNPNHIKESHNHLIASHESPRSSLFSSLPFDSVAGPRSDSLPPETASPQPKQFETTSSQDVNIQPVLSSASNETASGETRPNNTVNTITREQDSTIEMYKTEVSVSPAAKEAGDSASISPSSSTSDIDSVLISNTAGGVWTFKMASRKRNDDFHALFPDIPKDDRLIDDFTCAWLNDILIHGRLYISENCLAFHSKLFWTYQVILSYDDITSVERKAVAGLFQNAIEVSTKTTKVAYDMITRILSGYPFNIVDDRGTQADNQPSETDLYGSSLDGIRLPSKKMGEIARSKSLGGGSDSFIRPKRSTSDIGLALLADGDLALDDEAASTLEYIAKAPKHPPSNSHVVHQKHVVPKLPKDDPVLERPLIKQRAKNISTTEPKVSQVYSGSPDMFLPPNTNLPLMDEYFNIPISELWEMMYSYKSATNGFSRSFWEKCGYSDIQYEDWSGPGDNYGSVKDSNSVTFDQCVAGMKREFLLKVAINNPLIGKFTRCMITDVIEKKGVGYFCVKVRSQTPDVPGGNCLIVHTYIWYVQYDGKSRMIVTCTLEWIKSTWLKSRKL